MIPGVHLYWDGVIKDGNKVVKKLPKRKSHSFVKAFSQALLNLFGFVAVVIKDTGNTNRTSDYRGGYQYDASAPATNQTYGVVVGSSDTAESINDYTLGTKIGHGINAGQLQYSAVAIGAPSWDATSNYFVITRIFTNGSGGDVTVKEIGIEVFDSAMGYYYCFTRDVLVSPIVLTNGQNLTLNYTIKVTL
jgi:hypothetical protein